MNWTLPGTTLPGNRSEAHRTQELFQSMMLTGGLTLGQVSTVTGLEPHTIQNWVKRGFLAPPKGKRYNMEQLCRIITINMLRGTLPLERICGLLSYINGSLTDESDDIIDDTVLYFMFVRLAAQARTMENPAQWQAAIDETLAGYEEPFSGAAQRIGKVMKIMLTAWISTRLRQETETMLTEII